MPDSDRHLAAALRDLAQRLGVQTSFTDASGQRQEASGESLASVIEAMGHPAQSQRDLDEVTALLLERERRQTVEPVYALWRGRPSRVDIRLSGIDDASGSIDCTLTLEDGSAQSWSVSASELEQHQKRTRSGAELPHAVLELPRELPEGYHTLAIKSGSVEASALLICAPERSYQGKQSEQGERRWGLFCPTYALRPEDPSRDMGCGDLTDLEDLARWSASLGGRVVATLPMLSLHLDEPFDPSPYAPVSRLFWNELYADPRRAPEYERSDEARQLLASSALQDELAALRASPLLIDYRKAANVKRRVLEALARTFWSEDDLAQEKIAKLEEISPRLQDYATFRAIAEKHRAGWPRWPDRLKKGRVQPYDYDPEIRRYHLYVQHLMEMQIESCRDVVRASAGAMYLDLPVGVSTGGFDVWKNPDLFAMQCATGAPPDPYFTNGQNWGFAPMKTAELRASRYAYLIDVLRHHMRHGDLLRLDHVMAFHRLFWIPRGAPSSEGVYVRYEHEEIYAILCLESHRHRCQLVGENLGTVPRAVNEAIDRHAIGGLWVAQYEMHPGPGSPLREPPEGCAASINTHDMAPFAKHWAGADIDDRIGLNMLAGDQRESNVDHRQLTDEAVTRFFIEKGLLQTGDGPPDPVDVRDALLRFAARSEAGELLINIEDLWMEIDWQNVPGTVGVYPNWQRRLRLDLAQLKSDGPIRTVLEWIDRVRRGQDEPAPPGTRPSVLPESAGEHHAIV